MYVIKIIIYDEPLENYLNVCYLFIYYLHYPNLYIILIILVWNISRILISYRNTRVDINYYSILKCLFRV